jgi:hypothetical protein
MARVLSLAWLGPAAGPYRNKQFYHPKKCPLWARSGRGVRCREAGQMTEVRSRQSERPVQGTFMRHVFS